MKSLFSGLAVSLVLCATGQADESVIYQSVTEAIKTSQHGRLAPSATQFVLDAAGLEWNMPLDLWGGASPEAWTPENYSFCLLVSKPQGRVRLALVSDDGRVLWHKERFSAGRPSISNSGFVALFSVLEPPYDKEGNLIPRKRAFALQEPISLEIVAPSGEVVYEQSWINHYKRSDYIREEYSFSPDNGEFVFTMTTADTNAAQNAGGSVVVRNQINIVELESMAVTAHDLEYAEPRELVFHPSGELILHALFQAAVPATWGMYVVPGDRGNVKKVTTMVYDRR